MLRRAYFWSMGVLVFALALTAYGQQDTATPAPPDAPMPSSNPPPPRSDVDDSQPPDRPLLRKKSTQDTPIQGLAKSPNDSSSRTTMIDISPPVGDVQEHPDSEIPEDLGMNEMHAWNPHRAEKDVEVGDYYFKQKNYRGAESRYRDALSYKPSDAIATFRLAQVMEKTGRPIEAQQYYADYLKIMPHGPYAADSHKALEHLQAQSKDPSKAPH
ncbi:MAG TPA: tetratricopeptide repeat protein [Terriglobales bacterium]|nr:tetratricopeptide repeat protein [Terriglobales bacterium]